MQEEHVLSRITVGKQPGWLKEYREKNLELAEKIPLKKSNYTDNEALWKKVQALESQESSLSIKTEKIEILSWEQAAKEKREEVQKALESEAMPSSRIEAFANAFFNNGFVAVIPKDFEKKELVEISLEAQKNCIAKNIFIFEESSQASIIEKISGSKELFLNETMLLEQNSEANFCRMHLINENSMLHQQTILQKDSKMANANAWLSAKQTKSSTLNILSGHGASIQQLDLLFGKEKQFFDLSMQNLHSAPDATSYSLFKAVLEGEAKSAFDGMIKIPPTGQRANALLEAHSMLLSEKASSNNIPGLEIEADDVKATHSASVAQLEEEHLFYLQSKGIENKNAKQLVTTSFLEAAIFRLPVQFHEMLEKQLESALQ